MNEPSTNPTIRAHQAIANGIDELIEAEGLTMGAAAAELSMTVTDLYDYLARYCTTAIWPTAADVWPIASTDEDAYEESFYA